MCGRYGVFLRKVCFFVGDLPREKGLEGVLVRKVSATKTDLPQ